MADGAFTIESVPRRACAGCTRLCSIAEISRRSTLCRVCRGTCVGCKRLVGIEQLSRARYCERCEGAHVTRARARGATVHPTMPFAEDQAAQDFVAAHPGGATLEVCGDALGITRERLRQIETKAIKSLRKRCRLVGITAEDLAAVLAGRRSNVEHMAPTTSPVGYTGRTPSEAKVQPTLPEELYSPEGQRLAAAVGELEARAGRLSSLLEEGRRA